MKKLSTNEFIDKANKVHNNFYSYENTNYINSDTRIKITCPIHGKFEQIPYHHLAGHRCKKCSTVQLESILENKKDKFIQKSNKIHNNFYSYDEVIFVNQKTKVKITCPTHGIFLQTPDAHQSGRKCGKCAININGRNQLSCTSEFIQKSNKIHNNFYSYENAIYCGNKINLIITCPIHGNFLQRPSNHLSGRGCSKCKVYSKNELRIKKYLTENNIEYEYQKTFPDLFNKHTNYPYRYDFYIPHLNLILEYDGEHHYKSIDWWGGDDYFKKVKEADNIKNEYCKNNNIDIIRISYKSKNKLYDVLDKIFNLE